MAKGKAVKKGYAEKKASPYAVKTKNPQKQSSKVSKKTAKKGKNTKFSVKDFNKATQETARAQIAEEEIKKNTPEVPPQGLNLNINMVTEEELDATAVMMAGL